MKGGGHNDKQNESSHSLLLRQSVASARRLNIVADICLMHIAF